MSQMMCLSLNCGSKKLEKENCDVDDGQDDVLELDLDGGQDDGLELNLVMLVACLSFPTEVQAEDQ